MAEVVGTRRSLIGTARDLTRQAGQDVAVRALLCRWHLEEVLRAFQSILSSAEIHDVAYNQPLWWR